MSAETEWEHNRDLDFILGYIKECAEGWEPNVRLLGNARAGDIIRAIDKVMDERDRLLIEKDAWEHLRYAAKEARDERDALRVENGKLKAAIKSLGVGMRAGGSVAQ
jgi:hypothetical protein